MFRNMIHVVQCSVSSQHGGCRWSDAYLALYLFCGPYCGCAALKGHFFSQDSLANSVFLAKIPQPWVYVSSEVIHQWANFVTKNPLKIRENHLGKG